MIDFLLTTFSDTLSDVRQDILHLAELINGETNTRKHFDRELDHLLVIHRKLIDDLNCRMDDIQRATEKGNTMTNDTPDTSADERIISHYRKLFGYHRPSPAGAESIETVRRACCDAAIAIEAAVPEGREKAVAIANLEQAAMWANKGIALAESTIGPESILKEQEQKRMMRME